MPDGEQKPRLAEAQALIAPSTERGGTEFRQVSRPGSGFQALPPAHAGASRQCTPMKAFPPWGELSPSWISEQDRSVQPSVSGSSDTQCALNLLFQKPVRMSQELTLKLCCKKVFEGHR